MRELKTKEDVIEFLEKGLFYEPNRVEEIFYQKFVKLRKKIHRVLENKITHILDYDVYVNSILVDCRAIFLESKRYKNNGTLQNLYRKRGFENKAQEIDDFFDEICINNKSKRDIIKSWVDNHIVHFDFIEDQEEQIHYDDISELTKRDKLWNIFHEVLLIANDYETFRKTYGKNFGDQAEKISSILTASPPDQDID